MKSTFFSLFIGTLLFLSCHNVDQKGRAEEYGGAGSSTDIGSSREYAIAIHGGAGSINEGALSEQQEEQYYEALDRALSKGEQMLQDGSSATDVVVAVIAILEDDSLFNAGKGAVVTDQGLAELDASIMDGRTLHAGAVAGVRVLKNPIKGARYILDSSEHVMLMGRGAEEYLEQAGLAIVPNDYFITKKRYKQYNNQSKYGTVGCVALDKNGNLSAGTSTGGMMMKKYGRIGDSPIIGAGTYADNTTCAVSCTGHGEYFIRKNIAAMLHGQMKYGGHSLDEAAQNSMAELEDIQGVGGFIALDDKGNIVTPFNTMGMFRAYSTHNKREILMYK